MPKINRKYKAVRGLLSDWYGRERGAKEWLAYQPRAIEVTDAINKAIEKFVEPDDTIMLKIKSQWQEIAGPQIAKIANPLNVKEGIIYIEVSHPLWLRELNGSAGNIIKQKINQVGGKKFCKDIRFVPFGSRDTSNNKYIKKNNYAGK